MGEYLGIICTDDRWGLSLMLQNYENYYYLRVEDSAGLSMLKCLFDSDGFVPSYQRPPQDEEDFQCVRWAQDAIAKYESQ